jgi:hypothetical protein
VVVGFARSGATGDGRLARGSAWLAVLGTVLLALNELHAIGYGDWTLSEANRGILGAGYGVSTNLVGLGGYAPELASSALVAGLDGSGGSRPSPVCNQGPAERSCAQEIDDGHCQSAYAAEPTFSRTIRGWRAAMRSNASPGPCGVTRSCSQLRSV